MYITPFLMNAPVVNHYRFKRRPSCHPFTAWYIRPRMAISTLVSPRDSLTTLPLFQSTRNAWPAAALPPQVRYQPTPQQCYSRPPHISRLDPKSDLTLLTNSQSRPRSLRIAALAQTNCCWSRRNSDPTSGRRRQKVWGEGRSSRRMVGLESMYRQKRGIWISGRHSSGWRGGAAN